MQKIVMFIEPNPDASFTLAKIGNLFMNRFSIGEDEKFEILKIYHLETDFIRFLSRSKGKDLFIYSSVAICFALLRCYPRLNNTV